MCFFLILHLSFLVILLLIWIAMITSTVSVILDSGPINGSQLAKMKKVHSSHVTGHEIYREKQLVWKVPIILKNDDFCAYVKFGAISLNTYRLITAYLLLRVNLYKIMHACWDFDASSARTRRVSALDKHQNWSASALFCINSRAQSKYAVVNLIHTRRKQTFLSFIMW